MTSLIARVGALEARLASQIIWNSGKRKRGDWICMDCKRRGALKQRRAYSDETIRFPADVFARWGLRNEENAGHETVQRAFERQKEPNPRAWGLDIEDHEMNRGVQDARRDEEDLYGDRVNELWEQAEENETAELAVEGVQGMLTPMRKIQDDSLLNVDYAVELAPALLQGSSDMVARCLLTAARKDDSAFIQSIPGTSFSECIRLLHPSNFTAELTTAHMEISESIAKVFGISSVDSIARENAKLLREIKAIRNAAGIRSTLADYRMLLRAARDLGSKPMAENMWMNLVHDGVTPDTSCYNSYMAAIVFDEVHTPTNRHKVRVIPFYQLARRRGRLGPGFTGYRIGEQGVKAKVTQFFSDMLKDGAIANEESFRTVITALAREGDIATVKAILHRMWNINVDGLESGKDEATLKPKAMQKSNPLRPTAAMLFTVAHAFGINNNIPTALRLVDLIARHYDLEISRETWSQLFEWTFVLSLPRTGVKANSDGTKNGQLPQQGLLNLWNTMTGAPYYIKPTMGMYNHLIRNLQNRDNILLMYEKMQEGIDLYYAERRDAFQAFRSLENQVQKAESGHSNRQRRSLESLRREYDRLDLIRCRNHFWARRWMRLLLSTMRARIGIDRHQDWPLREIPRILWQWRKFAGTSGNNIRYEIPGGQVEFKIRDEEEVKEHKAFAQRIAERRRAVLDKVPLLMGDQWVFPKADEETQWAWQQRA